MKSRSFREKLALLCIIFVHSLNTFAYDFKVDGLCYNILSESEHTVEVTWEAAGAPYIGDVIIPAKVTNNGIIHSVTQIGEVAFVSFTKIDENTRLYTRNSGLKSVSIPNSVVHIGPSSFLACTGLTTIEIPNGVTTIEYNAFSECSGLTSIKIPSSVDYIRDYAFEYCNKLTSVTVNKTKPISISSNVFPNRKDATLYVPIGCKSAYMAVDYWKEFKEIVETSANSNIISLELTAIGNGSVLYNGSSIRNQTSTFTVNEGTSTTITFSPDNGYRIKSVKENNTNVTAYVSNGTYTINSISRDTSIEVEFEADSQIISFADASVKAICVANWDTNGDGELSKQEAAAVKDIGTVFRNKTITSFDELKYFTGLEAIPFNAFQDCSGLTSITIPNSVKSIGTWAFQDCSGLTSITIPNSVTSIGVSAFRRCSSLTSITIPNSVTSIGDWAFRECSSLTSITIPNSVTRIGTWAFQDCSGLTSITIPNSVTSIGGGAFSGCSSLTSITIPNSVKSIGDGAFSGCSSLTSITIPNSVTSIGDSAFYGCSGLTSITIPNSVTSIGNSAFSGCSSLTSITIPNSVTSIGNSAFSGCSSLTSITIPYSVTSIGDGAFQKCSGLTSITIPNSVSNIGAYAFSGCRGLTSITISNSVKSIGESAFSGCSSLTSITIPYSVKSIGDKAFYYCSGLTSITIPNSVTSIGNSAFYYCSGLTSITIPNSVTSIGNSAFQQCSGLTSITIPNSVTSIGESAFRFCFGLTSIMISNGITSIGNNAFAECVGLTTITIPNSVTSIGSSAFQGCRNLASITIPANVINIGEGAFHLCEGLTSVISEIQNPFQIEESVFSGISSNAILHVPKGTKSKYEIFSGWTKNFKEIIESSSGTANYTLSITVTGSGSASYNGTSIRNKTQSFTVNEGTSATVTFTPDTGYRIKSVKVNNLDVTSSVSNSQYTVSNIQNNTTVEAEFEVIPSSIDITQYISAVSIGGSITQTNNLINSGSQLNWTFSNNSTENVTLNSLQLIDGQSGSAGNIMNVNQVVNANSSVSYTTTIGAAGIHTPVTCRFRYTYNGNEYYTDAEYTGNQGYTLSIKSTGNGQVNYNGKTIRNTTEYFPVDFLSSVTLTITPDDGYRVKSVKVNNNDVTSRITNNSYTLSLITSNETVEVIFEAMQTTVTAAGVNYSITSQTLQTVSVANGNYGQVLTVPATITQNGTTWKVTGIEANALSGNTQLAAIIWNPEVAFTATVSNPNLLLYVKSSSYAPAAIQNVVVSGTANSIVLTEAQSGNNFYCPQMFTARRIIYTHNYRMTTGIGESRGWETIALPFDVQSITHSTKGEITPFAKWKSGDSNKPFWLYELTGSGFVEAGSIKAYTPYIISMPNNAQYDSQWLLNGSVTFAASDVIVGKTEDMKTATYQDRTFVPNYADKGAAEGLYALNVSNDITTNNSGMTEGSKFMLNMRQVHPFEAYMTSSSNARTYFDIFDDLSTDIKEELIVRSSQFMVGERVYDLQGRKVEHPSKKGVYIVNGKKMIIK